VQVIKDSFNNAKITTEFLNVAGGDHGGSWAVRIKGEPIDLGRESFSSGMNILHRYFRKTIPNFDYLLFWS